MMRPERNEMVNGRHLPGGSHAPSPQTRSFSTLLITTHVCQICASAKAISCPYTSILITGYPLSFTRQYLSGVPHPGGTTPTKMGSSVVQGSSIARAKWQVYIYCLVSLIRSCS